MPWVALVSAEPEASVGRVAEGQRRATVALVGRPNSGKSSLYNRLTGGDAHVGNFPGITVDLLESDLTLPSYGLVRLVDLPGLYSIEAAVDPASDEGIARTFIASAEASGEPLLVMQVIDGTQLALGLRLTRELVRRGCPLLVVVTQADVVRAEGREIDLRALESTLGVKVVVGSARVPATRTDVFAAMSALLAKPSVRAVREVSWEPDDVARSVIRDRDDADASAQRRRTFSARVDRVMLHPVAGPIVFLAIMALIFAAVFLVSDPATQVCDAMVRWLGGHVTAVLGHGWASSFVSDGVLGGAGTVLAFLPQIVILTIAIELLEATGYLARGAFLLDRVLRSVGLGGRAFVPLLTAHACAVPAVQATRIMRDPRERLSTILVLPLMTCSARIPTYSLLISTFFVGRSAFFKSGLFVALYFAGIFSGLIASAVIQRTATRGRRLPLVLEVPAYRMPQSRVVARVATQAGVRFVRDVGTVILAASLVLWALLSIPMPGQAHYAVDTHTPERVVRMQHSVAASIGHAIEPVTRPLGFDWRINAGLIGSFGARELMVSTLGVIFGMENADSHSASLAERVRNARGPDGRLAYSVPTGLALLAFFVLACQCMSTVAAIRRETKTWRWPVFVLAYTYVAAYIAAFVVFQVTRLFAIA